MPAFLFLHFKDSTAVRTVPSSSELFHRRNILFLEIVLLPLHYKDSTAGSQGARQLLYPKHDLALLDALPPLCPLYMPHSSLQTNVAERQSITAKGLSHRQCLSSLSMIGFQSVRSLHVSLSTECAALHSVTASFSFSCKKRLPLYEMSFTLFLHCTDSTSVHHSPVDVVKLVSSLWWWWWWWRLNRWRRWQWWLWCVYATLMGHTKNADYLMFCTASLRIRHFGNYVPQDSIFCIPSLRIRYFGTKCPRIQHFCTTREEFS